MIFIVVIENDDFMVFLFLIESRCSRGGFFAYARQKFLPKIRQAFADAFDTVVLGRRGFTSFRCDVDRFIESGQGIYCLNGCWPVELRLAACQSLRGAGAYLFSLTSFG
ncbi:hypothetical protein FRY77_16265 [Halomonas sp. MG34]|nr:hypothetical protein [Halomonas sp. MG34]